MRVFSEIDTKVFHVLGCPRAPSQLRPWNSGIDRSMRSHFSHLLSQPCWRHCQNSFSMDPRGPYIKEKESPKKYLEEDGRAGTEELGQATKIYKANTVPPGWVKHCLSRRAGSMKSSFQEKQLLVSQMSSFCVMDASQINKHHIIGNSKKLVTLPTGPSVDGRQIKIVIEMRFAGCTPYVGSLKQISHIGSKFPSNSQHSVKLKNKHMTVPNEISTARRSSFIWSVLPLKLSRHVAFFPLLS